VQARVGISSGVAGLRASGRRRIPQFTLAHLRCTVEQPGPLQRLQYTSFAQNRLPRAPPDGLNICRPIWELATG